MNIHEYFDQIIETNHLEEFFSDFESLEEAVQAIIAAYPLPDGLDETDVAYFIEEDWNEVA